MVTILVENSKQNCMTLGMLLPLYISLSWILSQMNKNKITYNCIKRSWGFEKKYIPV